MLQVKKLKEHVYTKILKMDQQGGPGTANSNSQVSQDQSSTQGVNDSNNNNDENTNSVNININTNEANSSIDIPLVANRTIELICSDQVWLEINKWKNYKNF